MKIVRNEDVPTLVSG